MATNKSSNHSFHDASCDQECTNYEKTSNESKACKRKREDLNLPFVTASKSSAQDSFSWWTNLLLDVDQPLSSQIMVKQYTLPNVNEK